MRTLKSNAQRKRSNPGWTASKRAKPRKNRTRKAWRDAGGRANAQKQAAEKRRENAT